MFFIKGWTKTSSIDILCYGSFIINPLMNDFIFSLKSSGYVSVALKLKKFLHSKSFSLFILCSCDKMELFLFSIHKLKFQYTTNQLFHHIHDLGVFQEQHNRKFHNMFFFSVHHKKSPIRNLPIYIHADIKIKLRCS